jgi:hypothetical protein
MIDWRVLHREVCFGATTLVHVVAHLYICVCGKWQIARSI